MDNTIHIGPQAEYLHFYEVKGYAVWRKILPDGVTSWLIAKRPEKIPPTNPPVPGSVCCEYASREIAVATLDRWATDLLPPLLPRKPRKPGARKPGKRSGFNPKRPGAGQLSLPL